MKTTETKCTHSQPHDVADQSSVERTFFSEPSSEQTSFFQPIAAPTLQTKPNIQGQAFFQPTSAPTVQAKCADCAAEEKLQHEEMPPEQPTLQRMPAFASGAEPPEDSRAEQPLVQFSLTLSQPEDPAEREADAIADQAVSMQQEAVIQRQPTAPTQQENIASEIEADLEQEIEEAEAGANQDADLMLRASASRLHLLLTWRTRPPLRTRENLEAFVANCKKLALNEIDTFSAFSPSGVELALAFYPKGFPLTWSGRVHEALTLGSDPTTLMLDWLKSFQSITAHAKRLSSEIYAHGLPVPFSDLSRLNNFKLRLSDAHAEKPSPVRDYAREAIRYMQLKWVSVFAISWEMMVNQIASSVADGKTVPQYLEWKDFVDNKQAILRDLPARARNRLAQTDEEMQQIQTDALKLGDAALIVGFGSAFYSLFGILSSWREVSELFDDALMTADASVAGSSNGERLLAALQWAWDNDYFSGATAAFAKTLIDNGPEILGETALIVVLGRIPYVNIAVAIYLIYTIARDAIGLLNELAAALNDVMQAKTVSELQKASARLAQILINGGMIILIVLITEGVGKGATRLRKGAAELRAADKTLSEEAAQKKAFEQMSAEERKALEGGKMETAKKLAKKIEDFGGACTLGSLICPIKLPDEILAQAGSYPKTAYPVPMPTGPFNVQKSALSPVSRDYRLLQRLARENRTRWTHFDKALAEAEARGETWPKDLNNKSWEVHHIKQINLGGTNDIGNLVPLPKTEHQLYTDYWNRVRYALEAKFTKAEWDLIYASKKTVTL